jgi:uncharacterized protein
MLRPFACPVMTASALRPSDDGFTLRVRVTPRASKDAIEGAETAADGLAHLKVRVRAVPDKGKANAAVAALVAKALGVPKGAVSVISGQTARTKTLRIEAGAEALQTAGRLLGP